MPVGKYVDQKVKTEIITKVREDGVSVRDAAAQYGISSKTIYNWMRAGVVNSSTSLILENNKLRKELEQAYNLLGRATAEMQRPKR